MKCRIPAQFLHDQTATDAIGDNPFKGCHLPELEVGEEFPIV